MSSPYFSHSKYSEQAQQNRLQNAGLEYLCYRRQNLDPDDQLIVECCWLNCASVVSLRRPSASRLTLLRTHRRGINSNFIHDLLKANLKPNPNNALVVEIQPKLYSLPNSFWAVYLGTIWGYFGFGLFGDDSSTKFHHLGYNAFYCMHLMNACMDGWIEVYHFHVYTVQKCL